MRSETAFVTVFFFTTLLLIGGPTTGNGGELTGIIIPGFASTKLISRSFYDCPDNSLQFDKFDFFHFKSNITRALASIDCWIKCMSLDPYDHTYNRQCWSQPLSGLPGITDLKPGFLTGPSSDCWKEWLQWFVDIGIDAVPAPYDWRLSPTHLELYFLNLMETFESARKVRERPSLVFAHSSGNNVFRYFLEWLRLKMAPKDYMNWLDRHIISYFAIETPFLGSVDIIKSTIAGEQPISKEYLRYVETALWNFYDEVLVGEAAFPDFLFKVLRYITRKLQGTGRMLFNSFPSSLWMLPFSNCTTKDKYQGWPTNIIDIEIPSKQYSIWTCGLHTQRFFTACEIADGSFFEAIGHYDIDSKRVLDQLKKLYHGDLVLNPLTPWKRPPIKNVFCIYGVDSITEVGYKFAPNYEAYPNNWIISDVIYETKGGLKSRSGIRVDGHGGPVTGDGKVPYNSLSWCKNWLGPKVNVTIIPQKVFFEESDVQVELNVEHASDIRPKITKGSEEKYITFYEDSQSSPRMKTAVWEIDGAKHYSILKLKALRNMLSLEIWNDFEARGENKFSNKVL